MIAGMTLEDWFAGQIIASMIGSDPAYANQRDKNGQLCGIDAARLANLSKNAYQAAEAMCQVRATLHPPKRQPQPAAATPAAPAHTPTR